MFRYSNQIRGADGSYYNDDASSYGYEAEGGSYQFAHVGNVNGKAGYLSANYMSGTVNWRLNGDGNLTLTPTAANGVGNLATFGATDDPTKVPWYRCAANVRNFVINGVVGTVPSGTFTNMFRDCVNLTNCDLTNLDTTNATSMFKMFAGCTSLRSINLANMATNRVTNMQEMFMNCSRLESVDLSHNALNWLQNMRGMFNGCQNLADINFGENLTTANVTDMSYLFNNCSKLGSLESLASSTPPR